MNKTTREDATAVGVRLLVRDSKESDWKDLGRDGKAEAEGEERCAMTTGMRLCHESERSWTAKLRKRERSKTFRCFRSCFGISNNT